MAGKIGSKGIKPKDQSLEYRKINSKRNFHYIQ